MDEQQEISLSLYPPKKIEDKLWAELVSFAKGRNLSKFKIRYDNITQDDFKIKTIEGSLGTKEGNELILLQKIDFPKENIEECSIYGDNSLEVVRWGVIYATEKDEKELRKIFDEIGWETKTFSLRPNQYQIFDKKTLFGVGINGISEEKREEFNKEILSFAAEYGFSRCKALLKNSQIFEGNFEGGNINSLSKLIADKAIYKIFFYSKEKPAFIVYVPDIVKVKISKETLASALERGFSRYKAILKNGKSLEGKFANNNMVGLLKLVDSNPVDRMFLYNEAESACIMYEPYVIRIENVEFDIMHLLTDRTNKYVPRETTMLKYESGPIEKPKEIL